MRFELKRISEDSIPEALAKVERYRLLNEPRLAESICLDILAIAPGHQSASIALLLARTDQFGSAVTPGGALEALKGIQGAYERAYYGGIVWERAAYHYLRQGRPDSGAAAHEALTKAMGLYEQAEILRPHGNDDAILRWNTCARALMGNPEIKPMPISEFEPILNE